MIHVLVIANESLLADFIVSALTQENDVNVFRSTRDELGSRRDYSVVIIIDEEMTEDESIKLREINRDDTPLLLIRVSPKSRNVFVNENYHLTNPAMGQMVDLLREFSRKARSKQAGEEMNPQKKMMIGHNIQAEKHNRQNTKFPVTNLITIAQVVDLDNQSSIRGNRLPLLFEAWNSFTSLSLYQLRRRHPRSVTRSDKHQFLTGNNKV